MEGLLRRTCGQRRTDSSHHQLYCQNLSLFGKLFIDIKTLFFDCDNCEASDRLHAARPHLILIALDSFRQSSSTSSPMQTRSGTTSSVSSRR